MKQGKSLDNSFLIRNYVYAIILMAKGTSIDFYHPSEEAQIEWVN
jgi:hypothetical protein